jgi:hypothetical protein
VNLYHMQSLVSDGGIHWRRIRREYSRSRVGERGDQPPVSGPGGMLV